MNEVQNNRQVDFPGNYKKLTDYVTDITDEYIELQIPLEIMSEHFDWHHPTLQPLFNRVDVLDMTDRAGLGSRVIVRDKQWVRLFYRPHVARQLFPHRFLF